MSENKICLKKELFTVFILNYRERQKLMLLSSKMFSFNVRNLDRNRFSWGISEVKVWEGVLEDSICSMQKT